VPNWLSTHPNPGDRVEKVLAFIQSNPIAVGTAGRSSDEVEYQRRIDGIIFGDSPSDGIVRGNEFLHPELRLALAFPRGWEIQNSPQQVVAKAPNRDAYVLLQLVPNARGSLQQIAQGTMTNAGFRQLEGEPADLNGLDAYVGTYQGAMQGVGNVVTVAAHIAHNRNVYLLAGLAPANQFQAAQAEFANAIRSFRELSASQAASIRPNRVDIYTVRGNDTWASIAERSGGLIKPDTLAIMNNYEPKQQPKAGDRIKVVVAG
jgi:predicted Zn-dependent protease